ncbi:MAG: glycoside hydrolase family 15 protein [Candidatus Saccharibacteria bacterium]
MARPVILGNGKLTVGLNENGLVHDFYYPYVGLENLTTSRGLGHKIGVWIDGEFSWVDSNWESKVDFYADALVSNISLVNKDMEIELYCQDFVDSEVNAFCRKIKVINHADKPRTVKLFTHQMFEISKFGRADTAFFVPEDNYILDYKGKFNLLIYGQTSDGRSFDQYAIGNYSEDGSKGTFLDAEDGILSNNPVEHGGIDTVLGFTVNLDSKGSNFVDYWVIATDSQFSAEKIHNKIKIDTLAKRMDMTRNYWHSWFLAADKKIQKIDEKYTPIIKKSLMIIKAHTDRRGGIIASCDSSIYNYNKDYYSYVWPRDGAYAMWPLIRMGFTEEPKAFFEFCRDILSPDGYLMHKYQPDKAIGSTWHPLIHGNRKELAIQEDETALVLYMLGQFFYYTDDKDFVQNLYSTFIKPAADFMSSYFDEQTGLPHASYDLWEEKFLTSTYTVAVVYQALNVATQFAEKFEYPDDALNWKSAANKIANNIDTLYDEELGYYVKGYLINDSQGLDFDKVLDVSSFYGGMMFGQGIFKLEKIHSTIDAIEKKLIAKTPIGGSPRYENDHYFESKPQQMGNPWHVTTLWVAQYYLGMGMIDQATKLIQYSMEHSLLSGVLSEQLNPNDGAPISVAPLVWSHAEIINTILDLSLST